MRLLLAEDNRELAHWLEKRWCKRLCRGLRI